MMRKHYRIDVIEDQNRGQQCSGSRIRESGGGGGGDMMRCPPRLTALP